MATLPGWIPTSIIVIVFLALAAVSRRAFFLRTYWRLLAFVIPAIIVADNAIAFLTGHDIDGSMAGAAIAGAALLYALFKAVERAPERRRWLAEAASDPLVLAAPFEGRWRVAAGGPDPGINHHLIASDQRFACDYIRRDARSLGSRILAPGTGVVVSACDGLPDHRPSLRPIEDPAPFGNHVAIDTGRGVVFLCHLQNGSVRVQIGDRIEAGTEVGRCGNSGRTTRPHLHIHAQDLPVFAFNRARGIPMKIADSK